MFSPKSSWAQPSLSRDFKLLAVAVLVVFVLISGGITYRTYERHSERVAGDLEKEAQRIESVISSEMENVSFMLTSLGRQIIIEPELDYNNVSNLLKSFDNKNYIYSIFSWTDIDKKMVVSSNKGILKEPVDLSDRDFIQQASSDSWKVHIGRPIEGRVSGKWVIPVSMGITSYTGKFLGIISISIDIDILTEQILNLVRRDGISFAVVSKEMVKLAEISDNKNFINDNFPATKFVNVDFDKNPSGLVSKGDIVWGTGIYSYYRASENYPYIVMMGYNANYSDEAVRTMLWSRLLMILAVALFLVSFLWIVRLRVIKPVLDMTGIVSSIARGEKFVPMQQNGSVEIEGLAAQVQLVSKYIDENKRIESELRNKMFFLKKAKENSEINMLSKSEFLAYVAQDMRMPINNIIGFSQVLRDQVYGAIENRKYRQYANDIFVTSNQLIDKIQNIILHSKTEIGHIELQEKSLDVSLAVSSILRQMADKLQSRKVSIKMQMDDDIPNLLADEFRFQQIISNLLLIMLDETKEDEFIRFEAKIVNEHRDRQFLVLVIGNSGNATVSKDRLFALASKLFASMSNNSEGNYNPRIAENEISDLRFILARKLTEMHGCVLHTETHDEKIKNYLIFFPSSRIVFRDEEES
ncbi:MAG: cache domain-containing protein [Pseudomonadota bacterium]